jgi:hypothetical protein
MCQVPDWETASFHTEHWRRARKEHRCQECRGAIAIGERHLYVTMKVDDVTNHRVCWFCDALGEAFGRAQRRICGPGGWYGWCVGSLWEGVREFMEEHSDLRDYQPPRLRSSDVVMEFMGRR